MTAARLLLQSLRFYWRTHLGVVLGSALGALVLTGALAVGDSVRATLRRQAMERAGRIEGAVLGGDRFFRSALAGEISPGTAPVLLVRGSIARADGKARLNQAQVLGIPAAFWKVGPPGSAGPELSGPTALLNQRAAEQLGAKSGETVIIRLEKPSSFSRDAPLSGAENETVALRVQVAGVATAENFGNFSLQANQVPPFTVFLPLPFLQERLGIPQGANLLLSGDQTSDGLRSAVAARWQLADAELQFRTLEHGQGTELRTARVFLDPATVQAAPPGTQALTYLVNEIRAGEKSTPYSMATAVDADGGGLLPQRLGENECAISQWEADDLGVGVGAKVALKYFVMGERRKLEERSSEFTVAAVLPMDRPQLDGSWMPDFPGLSDKKNCRDWEPGFAIDNSRIRDQDEKYWDQYRGTPKVFIPLAAGQRLWANRWGNLTSIRYAPGAVSEAELTAKLHAALTPPQLGFSFLPLAQQAQAATRSPVDFGALFVYFSFFLLIAAAVLTGMLFVFSLEQRNDEAGLLLALGWPPRQVRRLLLLEGAALAALGSLLGVLGAVIYTWLVLRALATVWRGASGGLVFSVAIEPATLATGFASGILVALAAMWLASRQQLRQTAGALLSGRGTEGENRPRRRSWSTGIAIGALVSAAGLLLVPAARSPEGFFGIGSLLLLAGLAYALASLRRTAAGASEALSLPILGHRNAARRRGRSMATIAVLASGVFMVVAVDAFRQRASETPGDRHSGAGGFALLGESSLPIYEDLNSPAGREAFALNDKALEGVSIVPMRVREGDDASCLNLNAALQPRLLGVPVADLQSRGAFRFAQSSASWALLDQPVASGEPIPAIVDATTLKWALKKSLGDVVEFRDERGAAFPLKIVATVQGSLLQGSVFIGEGRFVEMFPGSGGYRFFLIDAPADRATEVGEELSRALTDRGLEITPAARRLAEFQAVENTYLSIFQALGGLGLLLGSVGLAIVVSRNVLERRGEFALLQAVGFRSGQLRRLVLVEHRWLILCGLAIGTISALVGVWPSLHERAGGFPFREMSLLLVALLLGALFWTWLATRLALRRDGLAALRNE